MPDLPLTKDDIDCFFELGELALPAIFKGQSISVIYRENYMNMDAGMVGISNTSPMAMAKKPDVDGVVKGDTIEIDGDIFTITTVQPNSEYYIKLFLEAS